MKVHLLQDKLNQQVEAPALQHGRTRWSRPTYQPRPARFGKGCRKYGRNFSTVIGNPQLRSAGAGVIWTTV